MGYERIVVVKEQKRGGFWPFVGGVVLGAIVEFGNCLNLVDAESIEILENAYTELFNNK